MNTTIYFAHGKESGPWGHKITALAAIAHRRGLAVESPDYRFTYDADERVRHLLSLQPPRGRELVLVGSSMGGYVATLASRELRPAGLFLIAPALYMPGYEQEIPPAAERVEVVHGWNDKVIPVEHSYRFAQTYRARLHLLDSGHTLNDQLPLLETLFKFFLSDLQL